MDLWHGGERQQRSSYLSSVWPYRRNPILPIIERHVEKGATIYSDGWLAYCKFNEAGYEHFTVIHKYYSKKTYVNTMTQDIVDFIQIV